MRLRNRFYGKRSLFRKYTSVSVLIVFFSFLVLGSILTIAISNYWPNEKLSTLGNRAENVAEFIRSHLSINEPLGDNSTVSISVSHADDVNDMLKLFADDAGVDIMIMGINGRSVLYVNPESESPLNPGSINPEYIQRAMVDRQYSEKGTLGGMYKNERYIAVRPISYNNGNSIMGIVIVTSDGADINNFTDMVMKIFILSAIAALAVSFLAIGLFSYNLVKPLKQMSTAAKQFGKGDFSIRVSETSNDEIGELAVAFNNMAESLSSSEVTRKSFVANVSHELKTPMTTISGFIDGILDGTIPPEKHSYYLGIVSGEIKRLSRLVRSMLDLSRLDSGELKINYQEFDLFAVLVNILITFEQEIEKRDIEIRGLDLLSPKMVWGDKDLIHQVVYNLIENAVKFTNEHGYISFKIFDSLEQTTFIVTNSGTGIKKSEIPLVFDRFYKTDKSRSKDKKGLGLGLYLVRSIIRLHGGDIKAESVYGEYTEFEFYLPKQHQNGKNQKRKN